MAGMSEAHSGPRRRSKARPFGRVGTRLRESNIGPGSRPAGGHAQKTAVLQAPPVRATVFKRNLAALFCLLGCFYPFRISGDMATRMAYRWRVLAQFRSLVDLEGTAVPYFALRPGPVGGGSNRSTDPGVARIGARIRGMAAVEGVATSGRSADMSGGQLLLRTEKGLAGVLPMSRAGL